VRCSLCLQAIVVSEVCGLANGKFSVSNFIKNAYLKQLLKSDALDALINKAILVTGLGCWRSFETSKLQYFLDTRLKDDGEVVSLTRRLRSTLQKHFLVLIFVRHWVNPRESGTGSTEPREYNWGAAWKKNSGSGLENREYGRRDPSHWPRGTLYPQNLALILPTSGGLSVCTVRSQTQAREFFNFLLLSY
jgi:hypothetical protein